jgi:hypothetical protein
MELKVDYTVELEASIQDQIGFVKEEFDILFGNRIEFTEHDRELAADLLNYLSKVIDQPICLDYLTKTLESLEKRYPLLF